MLFSSINGKEKKKIVLLPHNNPDGDALGSSLALLFYLRKLKHDVDLISPTEYSEFFRWLPGSKDIIIFSEKNQSLIKKKIVDSDYIFFIDFNNLSRIEILKNFFSFSKAKKILIDHHPYPFYFDFMFSDPTVGATSILVFRFISKMNNLDKIDKEIATCLYVGMMTDTGFFRFPSVTSETHFIAGKLIEKGINVENIYNHLHERYNENRLKILSKALGKLKVIEKYRTAYTSINAYDINLYSYKKGDTEGIISYGLGIKNIVFSVFFFEEKEQYPIRISFRSRGNFDVNIFARKHFGGGGHKNAAGGILEKSLSETIEYFLKIIPNYHQHLIFSI
ncbi:bifunctional oligoribonuclease/PAP phosphatase NrnA [Blattabacterium sp. (Cryptocercus kyebangensis)]|uniref:DHH family phosphoesterase n=1 Tax=Blattabacterium sp. (Cryptocercus kyebangensis) TaxID=298656 RepID=UPI000D7D097C|nr:bifunctional oligoribonuclease/PAP phosphatase NrnA [Blattabacterium sp. (Cryptocercus kyebangensis)]AWU43854.1 bifunctional oligoribonuclease/PAP phosphatase NrnA [Blattabacterium sp. (Cryptocercus kyebangensis)]